MNITEKKHHYYTFPELFGHLIILAVIIVSVTGGMRLVEVLLPIDQSATAQTFAPNAQIASVTEYLASGYLRAETQLASPASLPSL